MTVNQENIIMLIRTLTSLFLLLSPFATVQAAPNDDYAMVFFFAVIALIATVLHRNSNE
ncbi:hypothetical protein [Enterovibrio norvegicus]|uniref:hypothetical protein n=1 Tax=Enterovibrio norvegicus TaxID=188144 RepID=UPI0039B109FB